MKGIRGGLEKLRPYAYLAPALIVLGLFSLYPAVKVLFMSFYTRYNYFTHEVHAMGVGNYVEIFRDPDFALAIRNTLSIVVRTVPLTLVLSLAIALGIYRLPRMQRFVQSVVFLPFVTSTVAVGMVWRWIFHSQYGLMNYALRALGANPVNWLTDPRYAKTALVILCVWKSLGYCVLILLTALRNISPSLFRAARVDGAGGWRTVWHVVLPQLRPAIAFVVMTTFIGGCKVFSETYSLFLKSPGPLRSCLTMVYYIYDKLMNYHSYGVASAASVVLFAVLMVLTILPMAVRGRWRFGRA